MRLIDADALKNEMLSHAPIIVGDFYKILDLVDNTPTIDSFGSWIPVEERSPEEDDTDDLKYYLVWYEYFRYGDYNKMFQTYGIAYFLHGKWGGDVLNGTWVRIIAWMPLPNPYEVKSNEV